MRQSLFGRGTVLALATMLLVPRIAPGQTRALTDEDVQKVVSLLRIEAQRLGHMGIFNAEYGARAAVVHADAQAVVAGRRDAFEIMKGYRSSLVSPPNGVYSATCARYLTEANYYLIPLAIFGFGLSADELGMWVLRGDSGASEAFVQQSLSVVKPQASEGVQKVDKLMNSVYDFYSARGYKPPYLRGFALRHWYLETPGVDLEMYPVNPFHAVPACAALGTGPVLLAIASPENAGPAAALQNVNDALDIFANTLDRIGWTREEYHDLRALVNLAHDDAHATQPMEAGLDRMLLEMAKESIAQRKKNAAVYRRHAVLLDPLIAATRVHIP